MPRIHSLGLPDEFNISHVITLVTFFNPRSHILSTWLQRLQLLNNAIFLRFSLQCSEERWKKGEQKKPYACRTVAAQLDRFILLALRCSLLLERGRNTVLEGGWRGHNQKTPSGWHASKSKLDGKLAYSTPSRFLGMPFSSPTPVHSFSCFSFQGIFEDEQRLDDLQLCLTHRRPKYLIKKYYNTNILAI